MSDPEKCYNRIIEMQLQKQKNIAVAAGRKKADLVLKNATFVNVFSAELQTCDIAVSDGIVVGLGCYEGIQEADMTGKIVCPGFIDAHIHLESSLVVPSEFARAVLPHGTTTVVTDPHEIANVMGTDGIDYMLAATRDLPMDVWFMVPSCVPASPLDESGAKLECPDLEPYFANPRVLGLAEMMDFPGVLSANGGVISKLTSAQNHHKRIDGHAPGLNGSGLNAYVAAGIYSDHECADTEDALCKLRLGQHIMVREGTAARNLEALMPLIRSETFASRCMFCTDDKHPGDLLERGHIDDICREAVRMGADPIRAVQIASLHAAQYFRLENCGAIAPGYWADLTVVENLKDFHVVSVYKRGQLVYHEGTVSSFNDPYIPEYLHARAHNTFHLPILSGMDFAATEPKGLIGMVDGQIITTNEGFVDAVDTQRDILKIAVVERHHNTGHIGIGYLKGYGLKSGAVATSVSHDSHNIICVGTNNEDMAAAVNRITENKGGIVIIERGSVIAELPLEIAGLMTNRPLSEVNSLLEQAKAAAHVLGVNPGIDPFMTLSFMSLPVIPTLRLTTQGIVDVDTQQYI